MDANIAADRGEGNLLPDYGHRLARLALGDKAYVAGRIHARGAGMSAGGADDALADRCPTVFVLDMLLVFLTEIADGSQYRVGRRLPQSAKRTRLNLLAHLQEQVNVLHLAPPVGDIVQDVQHLFRPQTAGNALTAGLVLGKGEEIAGDIDHAGLLVHDHHTPRPHNRARLSQRLVVDGLVDHAGGQTASRRPARLHRLEALTSGNTPTDFVDNLLQREAHGHLDQPAVGNLARQGKNGGALALLGADLRIPFGALSNDNGHGGQRFYVIDVARLTPQPRLGGEGRARAGHPPLALNGGHQRRFLTADEGASAFLNVQVEAEIRAEYLVAQETLVLGLLYS